jgi:D-serine deaminase-like pyridoxal phosphate-dependent protein
VNDLYELDTPSVAIDLDAVERNIARMQSYCDEHGLALRPHVKTHKLPSLAEKQLEAGAVGICCQKVGEAEVFVEAGARDVFVTFPIVGARKLARLADLARSARMLVAVDSVAALEELAASGADVDVVVDCDTGFGRTGTQTPAEAALLARAASAAGLRFEGFMTYPAPPGCDAWLREAQELAGGGSLSVGGTPSAFSAHELHGVTELRPGTYVYGDRACIANGTVPQEECALRVVATVVSRPTGDRAILDAGSKALTSDLALGPDGALGGHGLIVEYPQARIARLSEEHGHVELAESGRRPRIGEVVTVIPNHACVVSNLVDEVVVHRSGTVEGTLRVAARGRIR